MRNWFVMGAEVLFGKMKHFWRRLHTRMNVPSVPTWTLKSV